MHSQIQTQLITRKDQPLNVHGQHQTFSQKQKRIGNPNTNCENIQSRYRNVIWHRKMWQQHMTEEVKLPNKVVIRMLGEKETYKYLGILKADTIKQVEMKEKIKKESLRRTRKLLETKLYSRNLVKGINTWAVHLIRYLGPFLKWTREELKRMDQRTRKLMTLHKALHPRNDADRLYVSRREGVKGLAIIEDNVDTSIQRLEDYIEKCRGRLIRATRNNTNDTGISRMTITRKQKCEEKRLYEFFK